jgi:hypothetical protein
MGSIGTLGSRALINQAMMLEWSCFTYSEYGSLGEWSDMLG